MAREYHMNDREMVALEFYIAMLPDVLKIAGVYASDNKRKEVTIEYMKNALQAADIWIDVCLEDRKEHEDE